MRTRWEQKHPTAPLSSPNEKLLALLIGYQEFLCVRVLHFIFGQGSRIWENMEHANLFYFSYLVESAELQMAHDVDEKIRLIVLY
jgi:hypothetical protein